MKKALRFLLVLAVLPMLFGLARPAAANAAQETQPRVVEVDIGIEPGVYKKLTGSPEKTEYGVWVQVDGAGYATASINIRGYSSRMLGLQTAAKRVPLELSFSDASGFPALRNKKVKLINSLTPYRLVTEYLALELFSSSGIPTPAHTFAFLRFNDVDFGLYLAVEDINKGFLKKQYETESVSAAFKATNDEEKSDRFIDSVWFGHLFQKVDGDDSLLYKLLDALDKGEGYEQYINVDEWLRFFACISAIGGDGSIFTEKNNFALYDNGGKFDLIPWDLSEAFSGREMPNGINRYYLWDKTEDPNPLFDLLMRDPDYKSRYLAYVREAVDGFLKPERIDALCGEVLDAIAPYLPRDRSIYQNGENAIEELRTDSDSSPLSLPFALHGAYQNLRAQLDGREQTFFVNPVYKDFYAVSVEDLIPTLESLQPKTDSKLPKRIAAGYTAWRNAAGVDPAGARTDLIRTCVFALVCAAACAAVCVRIIKRKKKGPGEKLSLRGLWPRVKNRVRDHKTMLLFLLSLLVYEAVFARQLRGWSLSSYTYAYHTLDYSMGFCSRILPGAVTNLLFREITVLKATVLETVLLLCFFVCLAYFLEKLYLRFEPAYRPYALLPVFLFVTGPCSFGIYVKEPGMLDSWWLYCAVLVLFLLARKKLWPLIVAAAFVMILVYYASVLCFAPFVVIVLLYRASSEEEPRDRRRLFAVAFAFAVVAIGCAAYFISFDRANLKVTPEGLSSLMTARGAGDMYEELNEVFFGYGPKEYNITPGSDSQLFEQILVRIRLHLTIFLESGKERYFTLLYSLLLICPVLAFMLSVFRYERKRSGPAMRKFSFFCMAMLFFLINVVCFFVSTDNIKWLAHAFTLTFACFLIVLYREPRLMAEKIRPAVQKIPVPVWICYCVVYAAAVFHPYS